MTRRDAILKFGAFLILAAIILLGLSFWGASDAFDWDVKRCARLPDHWLPEFAWMLLIGPLAFGGFLLGVATVWVEWSRRGDQVSWLLLGLTGLLVTGAATLAVLGRFGPCPVVA